MIDMRGNREKITQALMEVERSGMSELLDYMADGGFFEAPCSASHHLAEEGGLAQHSLNVCDIALSVAGNPRLGKSIETGDFVQSLILCSLLHDVGKMGQFGQPGYLENFIKGRKGEAVRSEKKPFVANPFISPIPHEVRSVIICTHFIELTEDEQRAILWHNGLYGAFKYDIQGKESPLYMILHFADMWASRVTEKGDDDEEVQNA